MKSLQPSLARSAAALLGADSVRVWHDQALHKEAGGRDTAPYLDHDYWAINEPRTITAWIPFDGSTPSTGALGYVPGSHDHLFRRWLYRARQVAPVS